MRRGQLSQRRERRRRRESLLHVFDRIGQVTALGHVGDRTAVDGARVEQVRISLHRRTRSLRIGERKARVATHLVGGGRHARRAVWRRAATKRLQLCEQRLAEEHQVVRKLVAVRVLAAWHAGIDASCDGAKRRAHARGACIRRHRCVGRDCVVHPADPGDRDACCRQLHAPTPRTPRPVRLGLLLTVDEQAARTGRVRPVLACGCAAGRCEHDGAALRHIELIAHDRDEV